MLYLQHVFAGLMARRSFGKGHTSRLRLDYFKVIFLGSFLGQEDLT